MGIFQFMTWGTQFDHMKIKHTNRKKRKGNGTTPRSKRPFNAIANKSGAPGKNLEESALLQQPRHLLILSLPRFSFQAQLPKIGYIVQQLQAFVDERANVGQSR